MMNGTQGMSESQKKEMRRRGILFIHYFIRSPMYDNYTRYLLRFLFDAKPEKTPFYLISNFYYNKLFDKCDISSI